MPFKGILCGMKDGFGMLLSGFEGRGTRTRAFIAPDIVADSEPTEQGEWANLPPELLLEIIRRVEESEISWPARKVVVFCASVCKSWRDITKEIVKSPEECGRLTFPISLKQRGPKGNPIQCYIKRDRATSTYRLYHGLMPSAGAADKLLLAAKRLRKPTSTDFMISLVANDFTRASDTFVGKLRSNFMGTKFTIYDRHHVPNSIRSKQISPKPPSVYHSAATVSYELNVLRKRGPRRMCCTIPVTKFLDSEKEGDALVLKNKAPRWHEQLQCWCLNFRGRVTVASVKNFQLVASVDSSSSLGELVNSEEVILQLGKIGKDIFTMDYLYPLSAFQAFAICLSSFDTKPACE